MSSAEQPVEFIPMVTSIAVENAHLLIPMTLGWFIIQIVADAGLRAFSSSYRKLDLEKKRELAIRVVSVANGITSIAMARRFYEAYQNGEVNSASMYKCDMDYQFARACITSYFIWDLIVCFYFNWSMVYKVHGIASFIGCYLLMHPFADAFGSYYSGMFELSNGFIHVAEILRSMDRAWPEEKRSFGLVITLFEYTFGVLFAIIRVIGGSWVLVQWAIAFYDRFVSGVYHSMPALMTINVIITVVMLLQYMWFGEIVKTVLGISERPEAVESSPPASPTTKEPKGEVPRRTRAARKED